MQAPDQLAAHEDVCKRDMKSVEINPDSWEVAAVDRSNWCRLVRTEGERAEARTGNSSGTTEGNDRE